MLDLVVAAEILMRTDVLSLSVRSQRPALFSTIHGRKNPMIDMAADLHQIVLWFSLLKQERTSAQQLPAMVSSQCILQ